MRRPGAGEVGIDVAYAGLAGWPYRPGLEVAGIVRAVGADVVGLAVGDRVVAVPGGGGLAEVAIARAGLTVPVPAEVSLRTAAAVPMGLATAMLLLTEAGRFAPGDSVLVHCASGGIGRALAQLVPLLGGGRLIGTVACPEQVDAARESGYDVAIARDDFDADTIRAANDGRGLDVILEPLGTGALALDLDLDLNVAAPGARIVLFGDASGGALDPLPPAGRLIGANISVTGFSHRGLVAGAPQRVAAAIRRTLDLLAAGRLDFPVTELASLADVPDAHDPLADGRGAGKYVVLIDE